MFISEKDFIEAIEGLKKQVEHDEHFGTSMEDAFPGCHAPIYDNHYVWETAIRLLEIATNDIDKTIEWWIYETKFGEGTSLHIIEKKNGEDVKIQLLTANDLYEYLNKE
jgi:hypothetical protein